MIASIAIIAGMDSDYDTPSTYQPHASRVLSFPAPPALSAFPAVKGVSDSRLFAFIRGQVLL
jgi:hypothetical protein